MFMRYSQTINRVGIECLVDDGYTKFVSSWRTDDVPELQGIRHFLGMTEEKLIEQGFRLDQDEERLQALIEDYLHSIESDEIGDTDKDSE